MFYATSRGHGHIMDFLGRICGAKWIPISCQRAKRGSFAEGLINRLLGFSEAEAPTKRDRLEERKRAAKMASSPAKDRAAARETRRYALRSVGPVPPKNNNNNSSSHKRLPELAGMMVVKKGAASELLASMEPVVDREICEEGSEVNVDSFSLDSPGLSAAFSVLSAHEQDDDTDNTDTQDNDETLGSEWEVVSHGSKTIDGQEWELVSPRAMSPALQSRSATPKMNYARALTSTNPTTTATTATTTKPATPAQRRALTRPAEGLAVELAKKRVKILNDAVDEFEITKGRAVSKKGKRSGASQHQKDPRRAKSTTVLF